LVHLFGFIHASDFGKDDVVGESGDGFGHHGFGLGHVGERGGDGVCEVVGFAGCGLSLGLRG
jgi:hypothetical protein